MIGRLSSNNHNSRHFAVLRSVLPTPPPTPPSSPRFLVLHWQRLSMSVFVRFTTVAACAPLPCLLSIFTSSLSYFGSFWTSFASLPCSLFSASPHALSLLCLLVLLRLMRSCVMRIEIVGFLNSRRGHTDSVAPIERIKLYNRKMPLTDLYKGNQILEIALFVRSHSTTFCMVDAEGLLVCYPGD
ncbi:uncharacterized protein MEPE_04332 [Melanopsichium pennsylvanicum]|uniref:Uncharacterized protein n=1 Tax=Melanopsichium pennsylvanicum TaxID=63383 RepID=A0AAJ4XNX6_9BASI|nr:uncharacterized protein MEPE_04332 [Melanopsichium pennsylvanicum]